MVRVIEKDTCRPSVESDLTEITGRFSSDIDGLLSGSNIKNEYDKINADKISQLINKYPFLNKYKEILLNLGIIQVLGVGKRCIVIDNSREGTVLKLPINEDGYESLKRESHYQNSFLKALKGYYEQFGMYDISEFPRFFQYKGGDYVIVSFRSNSSKKMSGGERGEDLFSGIDLSPNDNGIGNSVAGIIEDTANRLVDLFGSHTRI